jgi:hypothetical protein
MDTMIAPVVRRVVGIARLFQDVFVGKENGFVPIGPTVPPDCRRVLLALATATALQTIDCDDNIGSLEYLN